MQYTQHANTNIKCPLDRTILKHSYLDGMLQHLIHSCAFIGFPEQKKRTFTGGPVHLTALQNDVVTANGIYKQPLWLEADISINKSHLKH